ncbi:MAG: hypothetical protein RR672_06520 [Raoultibacter sp.]
MAIKIKRSESVDELENDGVNSELPEAEQAEYVRNVSVFKTMSTQKKMRLLSEAALSESLEWHLESGVAYHVISCGDVDSLTYLRHVVKDQHVRYCFVSTWCMALEDAKEMGKWIDAGSVDRFDYYVGEIFKGGYRGCRDALDETCAKCNGRVARFRNHSKVMVVFGDEYDCVIESSANVDTNPRTEQTCITVDSGLANFYKDYFDGIKSFDPGYERWEPWDAQSSQ